MRTASLPPRRAPAVRESCRQRAQTPAGMLHERHELGRLDVSSHGLFEIRSILLSSQFSRTRYGPIARRIHARAFETIDRF